MVERERQRAKAKRTRRERNKIAREVVSHACFCAQDVPFILFRL